MAHKHRRRPHERKEGGDNTLKTSLKKHRHEDDAEFGTEQMDASNDGMVWSQPVLDPSGRFFYQAMRLSDGSLTYHIEGLQSCADPIEAFPRYQNPLPLQGPYDTNQFQNIHPLVAIEQEEVRINHIRSEAVSNSPKVANESSAGNGSSNGPTDIAVQNESHSRAVVIEAGHVSNVQQVKQGHHNREGRRAGTQEIKARHRRMGPQDRKYQERQAQKGARSRQKVYHWLYTSEP